MTRPAGVPNKNKRLLKAKLKEMLGEDFNPVLKMAENAVILQKIADEHKDGAISTDGIQVITASSSAIVALEGWDKIAVYVEPKLKAVEITGDLNIRPRLIDLSSGSLVHDIEGDADAGSDS